MYAKSSKYCLQSLGNLSNSSVMSGMTAFKPAKTTRAMSICSASAAAWSGGALSMMASCKFPLDMCVSMRNSARTSLYASFTAS